NASQRIAAQQRSGISVKQFCKEQGLTEYSFYAWRKWLQETGPVRFALVDTAAPAGTRGGGAGVGAGDRRAAANQHGRGRRDVAHRAGRVAGMIHLPASVRVYLCLTP